MNVTDKFTEEMKLKKYADGTVKNYEASLNAFNRYLISIDITDIKEVSLNVLEDYKRYLVGEKYKSEVVYSKLQSIKRLFEYLVSCRLLLLNPAERLIMPKTGKTLPKDILSKDEVRTLLKTPNTGIKTGIRDRAVIEILYSSGLRLNECVNLKVYDVDYDSGYIRVDNGKGKKDRILPLGKKACYWVKKYLLKARPLFLKNTLDDESFLWVGLKGKKLASIWLNRLLNSYAESADIKKRVTVHTLRRTFATHMLSTGANPYYIQRLLGHESSTTINKYIKLVPIDVKKAHRKHHPRG